MRETITLDQLHLLISDAVRADPGCKELERIALYYLDEEGKQNWTLGANGIPPAKTQNKCLLALIEALGEKYNLKWPTRRNSKAMNLALLIEAAHDHFQALDRYMTGESRLEYKAPGSGYHRDIWALINALANAFVFNVVRARRMIEKGASELRLPRDLRKGFLRNTAAVVDVRDVIDHSSDPSPSGRGHTSPAGLHFTGESWQDETSITRDGPHIWMGPIDLRAVYSELMALREVAGMAAVIAAETNGRPLHLVYGPE